MTLGSCPLKQAHSGISSDNIMLRVFGAISILSNQEVLAVDAPLWPMSYLINGAYRGGRTHI